MLRYDIVPITSRDHPLAGRETVTPNDAAKCPAIAPPTDTLMARAELRLASNWLWVVVRPGKAGRGGREYAMTP